MIGAIPALAAIGAHPVFGTIVVVCCVGMIVGGATVIGAERRPFGIVGVALGAITLSLFGLNPTLPLGVS